MVNGIGLYQKDVKIIYGCPSEHFPAEQVLFYKDGITTYYVDRQKINKKIDYYTYERAQSKVIMFYHNSSDTIYIRKIIDDLELSLISSFVDLITWKIQNKYKDILGYKGQKLIGGSEEIVLKDFGEIVVYFTLEIPVKCGAI